MCCWTFTAVKRFNNQSTFIFLVKLMVFQSPYLCEALQWLRSIPKALLIDVEKVSNISDNNFKSIKGFGFKNISAQPGSFFVFNNNNITK